MCYGFSGWLHRNGTVFFIEPNAAGNVSHGDVLARMPAHLKKDDDIVAFEFPDWTVESFRWDCAGDAPDWASKKQCIATFKKVKPICTKYMKARDSAWDEYKKVRCPALAEYEKARASAWAEMIEKLSHIEGYLAE